jgi:hypothetical protein
MELTQPHRFSREEVRARVRALAAYLSNRHGLNVTWAGDDQAAIKGKYKVVSIEANVRIADGHVQVSGKDPGMLWRIPAKTYVGGKLAKYLDPAEALDALPQR